MVNPMPETIPFNNHLGLMVRHPKYKDRGILFHKPQTWGWWFLALALPHDPLVIEHNYLSNHHAILLGKSTNFLWPCSMSQTVSLPEAIPIIKKKNMDCLRIPAPKYFLMHTCLIRMS